MRDRSTRALDRFFESAAICHPLERRSSEWMLLPIMTVLACAPLSSCKRQETAPGGGGEKASMILSRPLQRDTEVTHQYEGQIHVRQTAEIQSPELGYLEVIHAQAGQLIKEGDVMFKIMPKSGVSELKRAQAEAQVAKVAYESALKHAEMEDKAPHAAAKDSEGAARPPAQSPTPEPETNKLPEKNEVAQAKARWVQKQATVELVQQRLASSVIKAPITGLAGHLRMRNGSLVSKGDVLTTLSDNEEVWVAFHVPATSHLGDASNPPPEKSMEVQLVLANRKVYGHPGKISAAGGEFNPKPGTILYRADFPNPDHLLRQGESGIIRIRQKLKGALLVPRHATGEHLGTYHVFVVEKDGTIRRRPITIQAELGDLFVVSRGLSADDRIILEGLRHAHEGGHAADCKFEEPDAAFAHLMPKGK